MEIINLPEPVQSQLLSQICKNFIAMLNNRGFVLTTAKYQRQSSAALTFAKQITLPKTQQSMGVLLDLILSSKRVKLCIKISRQSSVMGSTFCSYFLSNREEITQFIYQANNLRLNRSDSVFYFMEHSGQMGLQVKINGINFISSTVKLTLLLKTKLSTAICIFSEELQNILFYYKLPGLSLHQYEQQVQVINRVPLNKAVEKITLLRQIFQKKRKLRLNVPQFNSIAPFSTLSPAFQCIYGPSYSPWVTSHFSTPERRPRIEYELEQEKNMLLNGFERFKHMGFDQILTTIEIKQKRKEKMIDSGGYSTIFSGIYSFIPQLSIHKAVNQYKDIKQYLKKDEQLVKKKGNQKRVEPSLKNEFYFLYYMRNKICPFFAKYYCNNTIQPFSDGELYLQYYPTSLADARLKETQKMKIVEDICMGLLFLFQEGIIHRDLKELNVMIDRERRGKLIDFGSVSNIVGVNRFKPFDDKIRLTEGYFAPYDQAVKEIPSLQKLMSKSEYYNHRNFDQYGLGRILLNQFYLDYIVSENHLLRHNLKYLAEKCMEKNPEDRLSHEEITIFIRQLMLFNAMRSQFWRVGFESQWLPQTLGPSQQPSRFDSSQQSYSASDQQRFFPPFN